MSHKIAKRLRKALGYKSGNTEYEVPPTRPVRGMDGKVKNWITGTIRATGMRRQYQAVKRNPVLCRHVLMGAA